jgi:hypothetical protein
VNTIAAVVLVLLAVVMFNNFRQGTLGDWFRAKFLNQKPAG